MKNARRFILLLTALSFLLVLAVKLNVRSTTSVVSGTRSGASHRPEQVKVPDPSPPAQTPDPPALDLPAPDLPDLEELRYDRWPGRRPVFNQQQFMRRYCNPFSILLDRRPEQFVKRLPEHLDNRQWNRKRNSEPEF